MKRYTLFRIIVLLAFVMAPSVLLASYFPGNARVEITDTNGVLSCSTNSPYLTVQCWFRISIPTGVNPSGNMTILTNGKTTDQSDPHAYNIYFDPAAAKLKVSIRNLGGSLWEGLLKNKPYLDRWYHVAVVRNSTSVIGYLDGQSVLISNITSGTSSFTTNGVSIGGWGNAKYFMGEIQEVSIYQSALSSNTIQDTIFADQRNFPGLVGYYKLGYSTNSVDFYRNFDNSPPVVAPDGVPSGKGKILFTETDQKGEQSLYDSQVNGGEKALAPLSGQFTWERSVLKRAVPGIPFDFTIGYSPAVPDGSPSTLGPGWSHSFAPRVFPVDNTNLRACHALLAKRDWSMSRAKASQ